MADVKIDRDGCDDAVLVDKSEAEDPQRRNLALALFGALGGVALLDACAAEPDGLPPGPKAEPIGQVVQAAFNAGTIKFADFVTDLRGNTGAAGTVAILKCYATASPNDGGGGVFYWDTNFAEDDGGTFFNNATPPATAAGWRRIYSGPLDLRWFGIARDDTSKASTNTQRLNALLVTLAGQHGPSIYAPKGVYYFAAGTSLKFHDIVGLHLYGDAQRSTEFQYYTGGTGSTFHAPWISLVGSEDCLIERITFFGQPIGSSGGVSGGTSPVDYIMKISSHDESGVEHGLCRYNHFVHCIFQGGLVAGVMLGNGTNDIGIDSSLDQNIFERCHVKNNDGMGVIVSSANTNGTQFHHCNFETNGKYHADIIGCPRTTLFTHCTMSNPGMLDLPNRTTYGYAYHVWDTFGPAHLTIEHQTFELGYGILKTEVSPSGQACGIISLRDIHAENHSNANGFHPIKAFGSHAYNLEDCTFAGNGTDGAFEFTATSGIGGPRSLFTRNVTLTLGATMPVTNFIWDGGGIVSNATWTGASPTVSPIRPNFGSQDLFAQAGTFTRTLFVNGGADQKQLEVRGNATQTNPIVSVESSSAQIVSQIDNDGQGYFNKQRISIFLGAYTAAATSYGGIYMGVTPGSSNFLILTNGTNALWNTPNSSGEHVWYCGFSGTVMRAKGTDSAPQFRLGSGSYGSPQTYTTSNHSTSRSLDEAGATLAQVAHVLGTLIADLQAFGWLK